MHATMVKVRLASRPGEELEVSAREAASLRAQGALIEPAPAKKAAPAAKEASA